MGSFKTIGIPIDCPDCEVEEKISTELSVDNHLVPGGEVMTLGYNCTILRVEELSKHTRSGNGKSAENFKPLPIGEFTAEKVAARARGEAAKVSREAIKIKIVGVEEASK